MQTSAIFWWILRLLALRLWILEIERVLKTVWYSFPPKWGASAAEGHAASAQTFQGQEVHLKYLRIIERLISNGTKSPSLSLGLAPAFHCWGPYLQSLQGSENLLKQHVGSVGTHVHSSGEKVPSFLSSMEFTMPTGRWRAAALTTRRRPSPQRDPCRRLKTGCTGAYSTLFSRSNATSVSIHHFQAASSHGVWSAQLHTQL